LGETICGNIVAPKRISLHPFARGKREKIEKIEKIEKMEKSERSEKGKKVFDKLKHQ
jgi:hypothetical protein